MASYKPTNESTLDLMRKGVPFSIDSGGQVSALADDDTLEDEQNEGDTEVEGRDKGPNAQSVADEKVETGAFTQNEVQMKPGADTKGAANEVQMKPATSDGGGDYVAKVRALIGE